MNIFHFHIRLNLPYIPHLDTTKRPTEHISAAAAAALLLFTSSHCQFGIKCSEIVNQVSIFAALLDPEQSLSIEKFRRKFQEDEDLPQSS